MLKTPWLSLLEPVGPERVSFDARTGGVSIRSCGACYVSIVRWHGGRTAVGILVVLAVNPACGEKAPERDRPLECTGDARDLRLWTFNLSHPDTVTLKNTGDCPVELAGVELHFDDRDEAFVEGTALDCTVRLPALTLEGGASARVSELPFPGEIDALANEVAGCAYPLSFNPDRGGVTYLCDGPCDASTLIDAVAHFGQDFYALEPGLLNPYRDPPPMRFGASFENPVWGTSLHNDGLVRYQRVTTSGDYPAFAGSDWGLASPQSLPANAG